MFNTDYNAWEVSSTATLEQKKNLFKDFITDTVVQLWTDAVDDDLKKAIKTWSDLTAYLFGKYIAWKYEYQETFLEKDQPAITA